VAGRSIRCVVKGGKGIRGDGRGHGMPRGDA
jgi:hypothetical protein